MEQPVSLIEWHHAGGSFLWRGHDIFVRTGGADDAPVLVLIHGFPSASHDWHPLWDTLCRDYRVIALDMIGFGFSDKPEDFEYSISAQANLIETLLRGMEVDNVTLLVHDYGNTVAQELLARQIDGSLHLTLRGICFLNGGLFPETHRPVLAQRLLISPLGKLFARLISFDKLASNFRHVCSEALTDDDLLAFWALLEHNDGRRVMPKLIRYMVERRQHRERWVGALQNAGIPLCLVDGLDDPVSGAHMVARFRELVPDATVVELNGIGHYPQLEAPEQVLRAFLNWDAR